MSPMTLAYISILVFFLMLVGLYLSAREFLRVSDDPSKMEGIKPKVKDSP
ncbi:MAG: hypothetical protein P8J61_08440 [Gammaproteobacteria bacterium]|jgi:hypothetical protein|nr:hypothetical protein [Gammaproteobacteria bacterium]